MTTKVRNQVDQDAAVFLDGVVGVVEANTFERHSLWLANGGMSVPQMEWEENLRGFIAYAGWTGDMPTCISMFKARIDGHHIVFWHATSQLVDYRLIDAWMQTNIPKSARRRDGSINKTDAMNFNNVFADLRTNAERTKVSSQASGHDRVEPMTPPTLSPTEYAILRNLVVGREVTTIPERLVELGFVRSEKLRSTIGMVKMVWVATKAGTLLIARMEE